MPQQANTPVADFDDWLIIRAFDLAVESYRSAHGLGVLPSTDSEQRLGQATVSDAGCGKAAEAVAHASCQDTTVGPREPAPAADVHVTGNEQGTACASPAPVREATCTGSTDADAATDGNSETASLEPAAPRTGTGAVSSSKHASHGANPLAHFAAAAARIAAKHDALVHAHVAHSAPSIKPKQVAGQSGALSLQVASMNVPALAAMHGSAVQMQANNGKQQGQQVKPRPPTTPPPAHLLSKKHQSPMVYIDASLDDKGSKFTLQHGPEPSTSQQHGSGTAGGHDRAAALTHGSAAHNGSAGSAADRCLNVPRAAVQGACSSVSEAEADAAGRGKGTSLLQHTVKLAAVQGATGQGASSKQPNKSAAAGMGSTASRSRPAAASSTASSWGQAAGPASNTHPPHDAYQGPEGMPSTSAWLHLPPPPPPPPPPPIPYELLLAVLGPSDSSSRGDGSSSGYPRQLHGIMRQGTDACCHHGGNSSVHGGAWHGGMPLHPMQAAAEGGVPNGSAWSSWHPAQYQQHPSEKEPS